MKTIIDCDPGHDDALALMLAIKSPDLDVEFVTTVAGNTTIQKTSRNALYILDMLESDLPVYAGSERPLERQLETADVHGESGLEGLEPIPDYDIQYGAVDRMAEKLEDSEEKVRLITLGPLTNAARLLQKYPEVERKLEDIIIMGGAIEVPGNQNRVAEYNMYVDPEAASIVMDSDVDKLLVPLDACNHIVLSEKDLERIEQDLAGPVRSMMKPYIQNIQKFLDVDGALMYDALAVYTAIFGVESSEKDLRVETEGKYTRGMTVADRRQYSAKDFNCRVANKIPADDFKKTLIETLNRGEQNA